MGKKGKGRQKSIAISNMIKKEEMFNIYAGYSCPPKSPTDFYPNTTKIRPSVNTSLKDDKSMDEISKHHGDYSPKLPVIARSHHIQKPNFHKQNMSIASQVIRSYRSFSRKHAFNLKFEVTQNSDEKAELHTYDNAKESESTKDNSISKYKKQNRCKSQMSITSSSVPEKIIMVKPIDGRRMLESIQETKESEQKLIAMRNRIEKLMIEKRKALSNIKYAKNRSVFISKVNILKDKDLNNKEKYREKMRLNLDNQREQCAKQRRELSSGIRSSRQAKIEENRFKKHTELQVKETKRQEKMSNHSVINAKIQELKDSVATHRRQK